ncbi:Uncharacterised protein [Mycobacteroides abscessus subsp. abscessus]|nr:Uncharacterised protein [Mycobacteroides abscessus subsp. abscessus]
MIVPDFVNDSVFRVKLLNFLIVIAYVDIGAKLGISFKKRNFSQNTFQ